MKNIFSRWVLMAGLMVILLNGCIPTQNSPDSESSDQFDPSEAGLKFNPFESGQSWSLKGTVSGTNSPFLYQFRLNKVQKSGLTIAYVTSGDPTAQIIFDYFPPAKKYFMWATFKFSHSDRDLFCKLETEKPGTLSYQGFSWFGSSYKDFYTAIERNDQSQFGECNLQIQP
jgi:hypothetical protein